jgi:hypothetical protein
MIWKTYHSKWVLEEILHVTQEPCQEFEELYDDYNDKITNVIEIATEMFTTDPLIWDMTITNIECNMLEDDADNENCNDNEDMYRVLQIVKELVSYPSMLRIELSKLYNRTSDDLHTMIIICDTLHRMFVSNT